MSTKAYDRWLKDAESWVGEDDWNPEEYLKWVTRLTEAKANLDETFAEVDEWLLKQSYEMTERHYQTLMRGHNGDEEGYINSRDVSQVFLRPIIVYNFYHRNSFEETPEKSLVRRVQTYLAALQIAMMDIDVAEMLQYAADKVPVEEAVEKQLRDYVKKIKDTESVGNAYDKYGLGYDTHLLVIGLLRTRVDGGPVDRSKIEQIFNDIDRKRVEEGYHPREEDSLKNVQSALSDDAKMELWLKRCAEPMVRNSRDDNQVARALEFLIEQGELKTLLELAETKEKERCSWEATIGPAVKALKRLGRTSAGKDMNRLAEYAKTHQKPVVA